MHSRAVLTVILVSLTILHCPYTYATTEACDAVCDESGKNCTVPTVCQPCNDRTVCPECFYPDGTPVYGKEPCCKVYANALTLTAAAAQAAAFATAAAFSSASAASAVILYTAASTSVGAAVSVSQAVSFTINGDTCCRVDASVSANAASFAEAFAEAAAMSVAYAEASAAAYAFANASAAAAAGLLAQAQSLIQSSCCGFNAEFEEILDVVVTYTSYAEISAQESAAVSAKAEAVSVAVAEAYAQVATSASAMANLEVNNCCEETSVFDSAHETALLCAHACQTADELAEVIDEALEEFSNFNFSEDMSVLDFTDQLNLCVTECSDVGLSCCPEGDNSPCCQQNQDATVCTASNLVVEVFNSAKAVAVAFASVLTSVKAEVQTYTNAISLAEAASYSAANVSVSIDVEVSSCKNVKIVVNRFALGEGTAVANALSVAVASAEARGYASAFATAIGASFGDAVASAKAFATLYNLGAPCCGSYNYYTNVDSLSCCDVLIAFDQSYSSLFDSELAQDFADSLTEEDSYSFDKLSSAADSCVAMIRRVRARSTYFFTLSPSCRCCGSSGGGSLLDNIMSNFPQFGKK